MFSLETLCKETTGIRVALSLLKCGQIGWLPPNFYHSTPVYLTGEILTILERLSQSTLAQPRDSDFRDSGLFI